MLPGASGLHLGLLACLPGIAKIKNKTDWERGQNSHICAISGETNSFLSLPFPFPYIDRQNKANSDLQRMLECANNSAVSAQIFRGVAVTRYARRAAVGRPS